MICVYAFKAMRIRLDLIDDEPLTWEESRAVAASELARPEVLELGEVTLAGEIRRTEPGFYLKGRIDYRQTVACDRCLAPIAEPVSAPIELWIETGEAKAPEPELELEETDLGVLHLAGEVLDTEPLLAEQLLLNVPMKPLCRPDCRGLCPTCGADLNQGDCRCSHDEVDPRWAALAELRDRRA